MSANVQYLDRMIIIRGFPGMAGISHGALALMAERSVGVRFAPGDRVFVEGRPVDHLYLVIDGRLEQRRGGVVSEIVGANEVLGAVTVFAGNHDAPETVALTDVMTLRMPAADTMRIFGDNFDLTLLALKSMALYSIAARQRGGDDAGYAGDVCHLPAPRTALTYPVRLEYFALSLPFAVGRLDAVSELARAAEVVRFDAGEAIWNIGEAARDFLIPLSGTLECETATQKFTMPVGQPAGLLEALGGVPRWHSARARTPVVATRLRITRFDDVIEDFPDIALKLVTELARGIQRMRKERCTTRSSRT